MARVCKAAAVVVGVEFSSYYCVVFLDPKDLPQDLNYPLMLGQLRRLKIGIDLLSLDWVDLREIYSLGS